MSFMQIFRLNAKSWKKPLNSCCFMIFLCGFSATALGDLLPKCKSIAGNPAVSIYDENREILSPVSSTSDLMIFQPGAAQAILFRASEEQDCTLKLGQGSAPGLQISESYRRVTTNLIERIVTVAALSDQRYYLDFGWKTVDPPNYFSFLGPETQTKAYSPSCAGPEFQSNSPQTFPFLGNRVGDVLYGVIGDTPGLWENRCFMRFDKENSLLSLKNGDGSAKRAIEIPHNVDAGSTYRCYFDGWQHIEAGETQIWKTWIFSSPVKSLYDIQLAAHLALANAKGFNHSALEAILRNTSYLLLRRNLLRTESDFIFISGVNYGWKQWVSDGFYVSLGMNDPKYDAEANASVFYDRLNYEDNAQYFLIWSLLVKRAGGNPDERTVARAYHFIRDHEKDGLFIPPRLIPEKPILKTYHDQLPYDDDDAPSSNQGFHCGALLAAKELGFPVNDQDIERAIAGYRRMFNPDGKYMATSLKQQNHVGQDSLYGEVLTYAVFGKKLLPDDIVKAHLETSMKIQSPYGMRVISQANGDLLEGHSGSYVFGGSWFLNDAANYLDGLIHGMDSQWVDDQLLWRLRKELAYMPAFHESISTVTGKPHGHHLYSWNSGYWRLRREVRKHLGLPESDPLDARLDQELGVFLRDGFLFLDPDKATLRPQP